MNPSSTAFSQRRTESELSSTAVTVSQIEPTTMFKDGLHLIFSYLNRSDWNSSIRTCHHWSTAAESEPSRQYQLRPPLEGQLQFSKVAHTKEGESTSKSDQVKDTSLSPADPYRLHHHITAVVPTFTNGRNSDIDVEHLDRILTLLPSLTSIRARLDLLPSGTYQPQLRWPNSLTHLELNLDNVDYPDIIRSLSRITHLHHLVLLHVSNASDWSSYQSLTRLTHLQKLTMATSRHRGVPKSDLMTLIGVHFPVSLKWLDVGPPPLHSLNSSLYFPNLTEYNLSPIIRPGDLSFMSRTMPNLKAIGPANWYAEELACLARFQRLESVYFFEKLFVSTQANDAETMCVNGLIQCPSLTALEFYGSFQFRHAHHWERLARHLPKLTRLVFTGTTDHFEVVLPMAGQLKQLNVEGLKQSNFIPLVDGQLGDNTEVDRLQLPILAQLIALERLNVTQEVDDPDASIDPVLETMRKYFDDPLVLPKLRYLNLRTTNYYSSNTFVYDVDRRIEVDTYRLSRSSNYAT